MKQTIFIFLIVIFFFVSLARVHAFYCDNEIIVQNDTYGIVISKCGEPFFKETKAEYINGQYRFVNIWYYNCGENDFVYAVIFYNGKVSRDESVKRGSGKSRCKTPKQ